MAATQVAAGIRHSCALGLRLDLTAGQFVPDVGCWGASATGATALLPKPVLDGMPTQIAAGNDTTCVVTTTGSVQCWAATTDAAALNDYTVTGLGTVVDLAVGGSRACAVNVAGGVSCWNKDKGKPVSSLSGPTFRKSTPLAAWRAGLPPRAACCWGIAQVQVEPSRRRRACRA